MTQVVELVTFKLTANASRPDFLPANDELNVWLKAQPGFVWRRLAEKDDGRYIDIVIWNSHADATDAAEKLLAEMGQCKAMAMIDPESVVMSHAATRLLA
jgi:hypothetical protein